MLNWRRCTRPVSGFELPGRKLFAIAFGLAALLLLPPCASASVSLLEVVRIALDHSPAVLLQREVLRGSESEVMGADAAFDSRYSLSLAYRNDVLSPTVGTGLKTVTSTLSSTTLLPVGLMLQPQVSVLGSTPDGSFSSSKASAGVTFTLPLLEGLGENSSRMALMASRKRYQAESFTLQHAASITISSAAEAYWNYVYAYRTLILDHQLVVSALESFRATKALAGAGEVAMVRADHAEAYLQQAEAAEIGAAQSLRQAWIDLFLAMGTTVTGRETPEEPLDLFPVPGGDLSCLVDLTGLKAKAAASRADLQAFRLQVDAANDLLAASRNRMKPRVNLDLWAGYNGVHGSLRA